jgi:uncharacterized protein (TIGR02996 family)
MSDEDGFLKAINLNPRDDTSRLVYADWLEERGDPRGEYLRLEVESRRIQARLDELRAQLDPAWLDVVRPADRFYRTASGREVWLEQFHVQRFDLGYLEGKPERIRSHVLERLPERAREVFPSNNGLFINEAPPGEQGAAYPKFIFLAELCASPLSPANDCSSLIVVWFGERLTVNLDELIAEQIRDVAWDEHAVDGIC